MKTLIKNYSLLDFRWLLPVSGGILIAFATALILRQTLVWAGLITVALIVGTLSFTAKDFRSYWLAIYALVLPLDIKKVLIDSEYLLALSQLHGPVGGEIPGPVLYLCDLPLIVLMGIWIFDIVYKKQKIIFPKSNWMALAFLMWAGLSTFQAQIFSYAFFDFTKWIKLYLLYLYVANNVRSKHAIKTLIGFLLMGLIFQGLICLYQYVTQDISNIFGTLFGQKDILTKEGLINPKKFLAVSEISDVGMRATGTIGHSNSQARYFEFLVPFAFVLLLRSTTTPWSTIFNVTTVILGLLGLVLTFSRGGLIGMAVGIVIVIFLSVVFKLISVKRTLALLAVGLIIFSASAPFAIKHIMTRPMSAKSRIFLTKVGLNMVKDQPIFGTGLNNHMIAKLDYDPHGRFYMPVHNFYLVLASEVGIPGLVFYLGFLILTCKSALRAARDNDPYFAFIAVGVLGALIGVSVHVLVDPIVSYVIYSLLCLCAGLAAALSDKNIEDSLKTH
ncbi:MAG: O-antigen ligase family protein [Planctomycetota bacterium]|jgi:O-antigen ligase